MSKKCEHGRDQYYCRECGGAGFCKCGKRRSYCKDCQGSQFCEHGKRKDICRDCGGSRFCKHNRNKSICKFCLTGGGICEHEKSRAKCVICKPEGVYYIYKKNAERTNKTFNLTIDEFKEIVSKNCKYCKRSPKLASGMGVDRINNEVGYELYNCVPCCEVCNRMKTDFILKDFIDHVKLIASVHANS